MEFQIVTDSPLATEADLLVVCTYGDPTKDALFQQADEALGGYLTERAQAEEFAGRPGQVLFSDRQGAGRARSLCIVGAGDMNGFDPGRVRDVAANGIRVARRIAAARVVMALPPISGRHNDRAVQSAIEGILLGSYRFSKYRTDDAKRTDPVQTVLLTFERGRGTGKRGKQTAGQTRDLKAAVQRARVIAEAVCHARDLINEPAAAMTPTRMAEEARAVAKQHGLKIKVLGPAECEKLGMGMFLAVGKGSDEEPRFIHLTYTPSKKPKRRIALIGKGVTFDSGGYSLKPTQAMEDMKIDMSGAAAVIAAMSAIAQIGSPHEVHAIAACCENLVSGHAYKLGDVLRSMDGTTVEINNTDAEGRLTLGDAITYARNKVQPDQMIDLATLTGACHVALGSYMAGVMSDDENLTEAWLSAARAAGEEMW
ncbi:MAG TPA: M17 family peptidase N-terminal domain-containing protein, partial [Kofleriaceae bacterium]|nr:M17 family peptidase N-terminal domain-containing protein [Kofleriaceae bacterium]